MDYKRLFLIGLLAFISFQLWEAWERDYSRVPSSKTSTLNDTPKNEGFGVHDVSDETKKQVIEHEQEALSGQSLSSHASSSNRLVTVKTDVLNVTLDLRGGTFVNANLLQYPESVQDKNQPYVLFNTTSKDYYVAQSGLEGSKQSTSMGLATDYSIEKNEYQLPNNEQTLYVDMLWKSPEGLNVIKRFEFTQGSYVINVSYILQNNSNQPWSGKLATQLKRKNNPPKTSMFQISAYFGAAISTPEEPYKKISFDKMQDLKKDGIKQGMPQGLPLMKNSTKGGWIAMQEHYFLSAWIPNQNVDNYLYYDVDKTNDTFVIGVKSPNFEVAPQETKTITSKLYVGPELPTVLATVAPNLNLTIDYGILWFLSDWIFWLMQKIYDLIGNWGWSIVIVTLIIKLAFTHLSAKSYRSMASYREKMQRVQPKLTALKERYSDDREKFNKAMMELYKREKINPIPAGGCLPILIQLPVFIALYWVLIESVDLRQAPFIFWISDLSVKDPYYILPILFGLTTLLQQKLNPPPPDPTQAKMMMLMPVFLTILFLNFPAGLVLYMFTNSLVSIAQQWYFMRSYEKKMLGKVIKGKEK